MKNNYLTHIPAILLMAAAFVNAACEDEADAPGNGNLTTEEWIANFLHTEYLWNDEAKEKTPDYSSPEHLFYSLLSLKDGKTGADGTHYYYSYIERNETTKAIDTESTYGFEFVLYNIVDENGSLGYYYARVLYVLPGSPAEEAGLERGAWITAIDGKEITDTNYEDLLKGNGIKLETRPNNYNWPATTLTLTASIAMDENPLLLDTILHAGGQSIGYLVYNHFKTGVGDDADDHTYDDQMADAFRRFKEGNVSEFVLDLRYNGGGYLSSAQQLGSYLVPEENKKDIFCYLEDNRRHKDSYHFIDRGYNLGLPRVFILVSDQTASASEAIINGLRPYTEVVLIGNTTEGKNVASIHEEHGEWAMQPIVSRVYNSSNESDYENGFTPEASLLCDELDPNENSTLFPLGDQREYMLSKALGLIKGKVSFSPSTKSSGKKMRPAYNSLARKQSNAVLLH